MGDIIETGDRFRKSRPVLTKHKAEKLATVTPINRNEAGPILRLITLKDPIDGQLEGVVGPMLRKFAVEPIKPVEDPIGELEVGCRELIRSDHSYPSIIQFIEDFIKHYAPEVYEHLEKRLSSEKGEGLEQLFDQNEASL